MKSTILNATLLIFFLFMIGCQKDAAVSSVDVSFKMLSDKTWYLSFAKEGNILRTYIGQPTYYITLLSNSTTTDSDGLTGSYTLSNNGNKMKLSVQGKTRNGTSVYYSADIVSVGSNTMVLSFLPTGQSSLTTLYYSIKN